MKTNESPLISLVPKEKPSDSSAMVEIHDRVFEAYYGKLGEKFMRDTQRRIHWVCENVLGNRVLDVGCSQGIVSILLAREGKHVVGLDSSPRSIEEAKHFRQNEPSHVQSNLELINAEFLSHRFDREQFDTIIITEVLEHLVQPTQFIKAAAELLSKQGRLIVTVPFGINDFIDHKRTYYLLEPYQLLSKHFVIDDVAVLGKWLGLVAIRHSDTRQSSHEQLIDQELISILEKAFFSIERDLNDELSSIWLSLNEANNKYHSSSEQMVSLKQRVAEEETIRHRSEQVIDQLQEKLAESEQRFKEQDFVHRNEVTRLNEQSQVQRDENVATEKKLIRSEVELETLRFRLEEANTKYHTSTEHVTSLNQRLIKEETIRRSGEQVIDQLQMQLAATERRFEQEHQSHQEIVARLSEQTQVQRDGIVAAEKKLIRTEDDIETLLTWLDEIDNKYRGATEQLASTKQRLAEEETIRQSSEKTIDRLQTRLISEEKQLCEAKADLESQKKQYEVSQEKLASLTRELETLKAIRRDQEHSIEQQRLLVLKTKQSLSEASIRIEQLRQQRIAAEHQATKTRETLSFQLGHLLIFGFKSFRSFAVLPGALWALRKEALRRQVKKRKQKSISAQPIAAPPDKTRAKAIGSLRHPYLSLSTSSSLVNENPDLLQALSSMKVACVMDEFTFSSYKKECNLLQLTPQYWKQELEAFAPELLFIESAWRGKDDLWGNKVGHRSLELVYIVEWCSKQKIPTVFWNKEDPVHFETFLNTAKLFDYIFTTDIDCISRYKSALGHNRVYLLPFACQPEVSDPIEKYERKDAFCFAGAYYLRYPERTRDLANFVVNLAEFKPVEIYDRNYGKDDPNYQFPEEYRTFIVGNLPFDKIDTAYKGYDYAINLNSIKQSQSMFARRVFELLSSNTIAVSNFSRGIRLLFGDLVVTTDSGDELVKRMRGITANETDARKFRLAALRKVMQEHTYQDRFAYMISKVWGRKLTTLLPRIAVTAYAKNQEQFNTILAIFISQTYTEKELIIIVPGGFEPKGVTSDTSVRMMPANEIQQMPLGQACGEAGFIAGMVPDDYYGPNYLLDLALATRYSTSPGIGKATHYVWSENSGLSLSSPSTQYHKVEEIPARSALIKLVKFEDLLLREWVTTLYTRQITAIDLLSIDEFNYCKNGGGDDFIRDHAHKVNDLVGIDTGFSLDELITRAESIEPEYSTQDQCPVISSSKMADYFKSQAKENVRITVSEASLLVESHLPDGKHEYFYSSTDFTPAELGFSSHARFFLDTTPGLNIQIVWLFLDRNKNRIGHVVKVSNQNQEVEISSETAWMRLGLRVYSSGSARVNGLVLGHRPICPADVIGRAEYLILTNHYPSYDDLYRNGFVHRRVVAYRERGINVDVFRLRSDATVLYHEFEDVDVTTGAQEALHKLLSRNKYKSVLVHFLDEAMWDVLRNCIDHIKVFVWVHGAEIQPSYRREFNYTTDAERTKAQAVSERRMKFWRGLLRDPHPNLKLIFVSNYLADEVMEDLGFGLPRSCYEVIHNSIDTDLFSYHKKPVEQRKKILSIRPYACQKYANDLTVKTILELSSKPYFRDLEFRLIGDGVLFEETVAPLRKLNNVYLEKRFLRQAEIANLQQQYGIFLCPTRWDSQGVSRDEAMSSGLVAVTNGITAIPEFVDKDCGILAEAEDTHGLAEGIAQLYENPELFERMSGNAAERVRKQSGLEQTIAAEAKLFSF